MAAFKVVDKNGQKIVKAHVEFYLGEVRKLSTNEDHETIVLPLETETGKLIAKQCIKEAAKRENDEEFEGMLNEYCKHWLRSMIGVETYPIHEGENGELIGIQIASS